MEDTKLFHLLLDLDEIENPNQALEKEWRMELTNYYQSCLNNQFWIRENEIEKTSKEIPKISEKKLIAYFEKEIKRWQNNQISLAELVCLARLILKRFAFLRNQFISTIEKIVDLIPRWFLEKDSRLLTEKIKELIIKNDIPSYKTGVLIFDGEGEYLTKPVNHIVKKYLNQLKVSEYIFWRQFNLILIKKVFLMAIKDFQEKKISLEDFSTIASKLLFNDPFWTISDFNKVDHKLSDYLDGASELLYYSWRNDNNKNQELVESIFKKLNQYYSKEKDLIEKKS